MCVGDPDAAKEQFRNLGYGEPVDDIALAVWRLFFWLERHFLETLYDARNTGAYVDGPRAALSYLDVVNNEIWFEPDVRRQLYKLYTEFVDHPKITLGMAREINGEPYDALTPHPDHAVVRDAIYYGRHPLLQATLWVEHRARLALLKAAVDYLCLEDAGKLPPPRGRIDFRKVMLQLLPRGVREGLERLRGQPTFRRYPLFWQVFLWGFGGFYLSDRRDQEFGWLEEQTGVPSAEIPQALDLWDVLYPLTGTSWLGTSGPSHCTIVKMVPMPVRGLGAIQRLHRYGIDHYDELGYADYTSRDLVRWHNQFVDVLGT